MIEAVANAYLTFAGSFPAVYQAVFTLTLPIPFDDPATPPELRFAFSQIEQLFGERTSGIEVHAELFWAGLHGIAELTRTKRFPPDRHKQRVSAFVDLFSPPSND